MQMRDRERKGENKMNEKLKDYYQMAYESDDMGLEINDEMTFENLRYYLVHETDVYKVIGVEDSLVRERLFQELAEKLEVDYNDIYDLWLKGD